ncbi:MAG: hypothetical protein ACWA5A_09325 [Marinibacterium sp.]
MKEGTETNRDRIRRLLFEPLDFRLKRGSDPDRHKARLDQLADDLAYMTDDHLDALRRVMEIRGEGKGRDLWPSLTSFRGMAQVICPRPLIEMPNLRRYLASAAGRAALEKGTLVEVFEFFERRRHPPIEPGHMRTVRDKARENARRLVRLAELRKYGGGLTSDDVAWEAEYLALRDKLARFVQDNARGAAA